MVLERLFTDFRSSANPSAIISSRLSTYLKRPCWSAIAPCPLAKELETVHPRRTYFYLTTYPHQPIPDPAQAQSAFPQRTIISPSLSSTASRSDEADAERRRQLSPSPEVDLSSPEFDDMEDDGIAAPPTPSGSFTGRLMHADAANASNLARNHRATSPPLEKDEKEFTQTARGMRKLGQKDESPKEVAQPSAVEGVRHMELDPNELFGEHRSHAMHMPTHGFVSSPAMKPLLPLVTGKRAFEEITDVWARDEVEWDSRSPENIDLDELDGMFDSFE
jgi:hypothetical protein